MASSQSSASPISMAAVRSSRQRHLRRRLRIVSLVLACVVAGLTWLLFYSSAFVVREVEIVGADLLPRSEVLEAAQVPIEKQLMRVDTDAIASNVAELDPIADVEVRRRWPQQIEISITEREAAYQIAKNKQYAWVDKQGVTFFEAPEQTKGLVTVKASVTDKRVLADLATVAGALPPELQKKVRYLTGSTPDDLQLQLRDGATVFWGSSEDSELKAQVCLALLQVPATAYDVSSPTNPSTQNLPADADTAAEETG